MQTPAGTRLQVREAASDEQLVAKFRRGEPAALQMLLDRHLKAVWSFAYQMLLDPHTADDIAQEACLRAIRGLANFRGDSAFRTWLFRIVVNVARDWHSAVARDPAKAADDYDPPARSCERPERLAMQTELELEMTKALAELPQPFRTALALTTFQGLSPDEAAEVEGCKTNTIYWRIHEARKILRQRLEPWTQ